MTDRSTPRPGELQVALPSDFDAGLYFLGRIHTPWRAIADCPKNSGETDAVCTIVLDQAYAPGLKDVETCTHLIVLYWMSEAPRDLIVQQPRIYPEPHGVFALRSPMRPNPIALSVVELLGVDGATLQVRGLDCLDGTPLLDIKPYFASTDAKPAARVGWHEKKGGS
jgi:tRNA-Thr(GGU) m(6)t(6)A37 methyltransferase TsaA